MIDRLEILVSRFRQRLSHSRWTARLMGYGSLKEPSDEPGLILVQIDGLGEDMLRVALDNGRMPFLKHLLEDEGHQMVPMYTGFPSSTPSFQAELFYGIRTAVPSFGYRDAELGREVSLNDPGAASVIEKRLAEGRRGLLEGGSAWSDIFSGGAAESHMCAATAEIGEAMRVLAPQRLVGLLLWHAWSGVRVIANLVVVSAFVLGDLLAGRLGFRGFLTALRFVPLQVVVSAVMREIVTAGASVDAERGLPVIQLNFLGYDEHAHRRGPNAWLALWSLQGIDASLRRVWMAAHRSTRRDYQVWVYSDHGQEKVTPYQTLSGVSIPDAVRRVYAEVRAEEPVLRAAQARQQTLTEERFDWLGMDSPEWLRQRGRREVPPVISGDEPDASLEVVNRGPVGLVYVDAPHDAAFLELFARGLVERAGIPIVALRDSQDLPVVFYADPPFHPVTDDRPNGRTARRAVLTEDPARVFGFNHPYLEQVAEDVTAALHHSGAGQLMLIGWNRTLPVTLQEEHGAHGGPGPRETSAFAVIPPEARSFVEIPATLRPEVLRTMAMAVLPTTERTEQHAPPRAPRPRRTDSGVTVPLRVMTYNVHGCRGMDGKFAPERIARVIARERPDVVCLQELDQARTRSGGVNQVEVIARRLRADSHFHAVAEVDDGHFGNAILTGLPVRLMTSGPLPSTSRSKAMFQLEDRGAQWVELDIEGYRIQVLNTHLSLLRRERHLQAHALLSQVWLGHPECVGPRLLAGDFNASPSSATLKRLSGSLRNAVGSGRNRALHTWSGRIPLRRIDHILISPEIQVAGVYVPRTRLSRLASDHLPVVVDLECRFSVNV